MSDIPKVKFHISPGMGKDKLKMLDELGIPYTTKFENKDVPCERYTEVTTEPQTKLGYYAVLGVIR